MSIWQAFVLGVLSRLRRTARDEEIDLVQRTLKSEQSKGLLDRVSENGLRLYLLRKRVASGGISAQISLVALANEGAVFDPEIEIVEQVELPTVLQRINLDLARGEGSDERQGSASSSPEGDDEESRETNEEHEVQR